jgi:hypothetical protein
MVVARKNKAFRFVDGKRDKWLAVLPELLRIGRIGLWELALRGDGSGRMRVDEVLREDFGYGITQEYGWDRYLNDLSHPDDRAQIVRNVSLMSAAPGVALSAEYRLWNPQRNAWRWMRCFCKSFVPDAAHDPTVSTVIRGCAQDIHDRIESRQDMRRAQQEALQTVARQRAVLKRELARRLAPRGE